MSNREPKEGPDYLSLGCGQLAIGTPTPQSAILKMRGCLTTYRNVGTLSKSAHFVTLSKDMRQPALSRFARRGRRCRRSSATGILTKERLRLVPSLRGLYFDDLAAFGLRPSTNRLTPFRADYPPGASSNGSICWRCSRSRRLSASAIMSFNPASTRSSLAKRKTASAGQSRTVYGSGRES
jgi:hypothetical protein